MSRDPLLKSEPLTDVNKRSPGLYVHRIISLPCIGELQFRLSQKQERDINSPVPVSRFEFDFVRLMEKAAFE